MARFNKSYRGGSQMVGKPAFSNRKTQGNYKLATQTTKRHQFKASLTNVSSITAGQYAVTTMCRFERGSGTPPAATASNNYQTPVVFNGSTIRNFEATFNIKNTSATTAITLDIFSAATSFFDALVWDTVQTTACPVTFSVAAGAEGEVLPKGTYTFITHNGWNNYKFVQHYLKKIGSITFSPSDGDNSTASFKFSDMDFPAKCRRSQTGMSWNIFFLNDSDTNGAATFSGVGTVEVSFDEIPNTDNPLPYLY